MSSLALFISFFLSVSLPHLVSCKGGFSADLIHRDSPHSPFYDSTLTPSDRLRASIHRTISRYNQLTTKDISGTITPSGAEYLMSVNIGSPPLNVMAIADTGSDLTWTQCKPCVSCYPQNAPIYDSSKSSTYTSLACKTKACKELPLKKCDTSSKCQYRYSYGDGSHTVGVLSTETFSIGSASLPKILFGCSHDSVGSFSASSAGLVGLGGGPLSLVSQLGSSINHKFSYCLTPRQSNTTSKINFGDVHMRKKAVTTPLVKGELNTYYTVTLESVGVAGGKKIAVRTEVSVDDYSQGGNIIVDDYSQGGNIIVDSGTTLTVLDDSVLSHLTKEVSKAVKYPATEDPEGQFPLCFDISSADKNDISLPDLTFQFTDAALTLKPLNAFVLIQDDVLCLAMMSNSALGSDIQIFGNIAQQNFQVEYDIKNQKLSFAPTDCSKP